MQAKKYKEDDVVEVNINGVWKRALILNDMKDGSYCCYLGDREEGIFGANDIRDIKRGA